MPQAAEQYKPESPEVLKKIYLLFRDYFDRAEKKRRWSIRDDIPWDQCNPSLNPAIADVVETFCAVETVPARLPEQADPAGARQPRPGLDAGQLGLRGVEALDGLRRLAAAVAACAATSRWPTWKRPSSRTSGSLPYDNARAMVCYTMVQELATWLHYHNLRQHLAAEGGDAALDRALQLVAIDERAHYDFFRRLVALYLEDDREGTLEQLRRVVNTFAMPAVHMLADSRKRTAGGEGPADLRRGHLLLPGLRAGRLALGLTKADLRRHDAAGGDAARRRRPPGMKEGGRIGRAILSPSSCPPPRDPWPLPVGRCSPASASSPRSAWTRPPSGKACAKAAAAFAPSAPSTPPRCPSASAARSSTSTPAITSKRRTASAST